MAKLLPLILAGILTTLLHEAQASLPPGPAVEVLVTPKGPMSSCKKSKMSVVFQSIKSKKGIVYSRTYTHQEMLKCFGSPQPNAATFVDCVNAAAVAGHSTLYFDGATCSTYNVTVPSHACADQKAAVANYIAIYQANPPLFKPNFGSFKLFTVAATLKASTNNDFDVTWTTDDGGCNYPGFFVSFSGQEKYVETTSSQTTIENIPECSNTDVIVSFGLPTGEKFGTTAQTTIPAYGKVLTVAATLTAGTNNSFDVTWTADDVGCKYPGFIVSFSGQENYVEGTLFKTTIENIPRCGIVFSVSFGQSTGEKFGTTATVATTKPEPQGSWPFNVVPGFTMEANLFPNKTIIVSYDASPGCGSFTKFNIRFGIKYTDETRTGPDLDFPISEPKGTIEIGTVAVPDICLTSSLSVTYIQVTDGGEVSDTYELELPLNELGKISLYPYEQVESDIVVSWPTDLTPYDVCGVLPGTTLTFKRQDNGNTFTAPISDGRITLTNVGFDEKAKFDVEVDSLGINLVAVSISAGR
ncbi:uncharacterized protein LOC108664375 [Hyalella azteca]|uniref:Uncharacterized protein LOC108664375 n=1 Tax=Hyalella azteca TaxID=294128 RepID=A0A8B7MZR5_HYAAZ|nr:uncharacterized protein LOC108664375 [Hyalella azteca]